MGVPVKILHTADVHFSESSLADLAAPCAMIVDVCELHKPDAVVIAGDLTTERGLIDNATAVAVRTWVRQLLRHTSDVFILAGNHDLTFREGQPNNLRAILADDEGETMPGVRIVDQPATVHVGEARLCFLPYPSPATFHSKTDSGDLASLSAALEDVVRGFKATDPGDSVLIYHGTVEGGRMGDESAPSLRTRGHDVVLSVSALTGFAATLCGHLHHPQVIDYPGGQAVYPGCVAPLTFGERTISPGVELWTMTPGERLHTARERHPLPVSAQRLQVEVDAHEWEDDIDATLNLGGWLSELAPPAGSLVKVKLTADPTRLALITPEIVEDTRQTFGLRDLRVEKTEQRAARTLVDGADRAARVNVLDSLRTFGDAIGDPGYTAALDDILETAAQIEADVQGTDADPRYEFEPLRLECENYKQFGTVSVDFTSLPAMTAVLGPTGIGKSNLLLAVFAALYGGNPKSVAGQASASTADIVTRGESSGSLRLLFRSGSDVYRITRRIKVDGKGRGSGSLFFEKQVSDDWCPLNEGTSRETTARIRSLVGPPDLYWLTRHLQQHGVSVVKMTAATLTDAVNSTLRLDFDARVARAKALAVARSADLSNAEGRAEALRERIVPEDKITAQEQHARSVKAEAETDGQRRAGALELLKSDRDAIADKRRASEVELREITAQYREQTALRSEQTKLAQQYADASDDLAALEPVPDVAEAQDSVEVARIAADAAQGHRITVREQCQQEAQEDADALRALQDSRQAAALKRQEAFRAVEAADRALAEAMRRAALLSSVPCRGETWNDPDAGEMDGGACELLADARSASDRVAPLTSKLAEATAALEAADADHDVAHTKAEALNDELVTRTGDRTDRVRVADQEAATASDALELARRRCGDVVERDRAARAVRQRLAPMSDRLKELAEMLPEDPITGERVRRLSDLHQQHDDALERLDREIADGQAAVRDLRDRIVRADADLEQIEGERMQREQMLAQIRKAETEAGQHRRALVALDYYRRALDRQGIPSLLLEQLAPQLEARVNDILAPAGRRLRIQTERTTTTDNVRTEVTLSFQSPVSGDAWVPVAELSGGEEDLANLAMAAGLARVAADMSGTELGTVILDEPMVGVSESLQSAALEVLHAVGEHVARSIVVTHRRDLAAACDGVLVVSRNGSGSKVEVGQ